MTSFIILSLCCVIIFALASDSLAQKKVKNVPPPEKKMEEYVGVESIALEKDSAFTHCPNHKRVSSECSEDQLQIQIKTIAKGAEENGLKYYYFVTGGKIIGEGANVVWDLTKTRIRNYSITVALGKDSVIKGKTITKSFKVSECPICDLGCDCPIISLSAPQTKIKAGDAAILTAKTSAKDEDEITYNWTVSNGKIEAGNGTRQIVVRTTEEMKGQTIVVNLEVGGVCYGCEVRFATTIEIDE